MDSNFKKIAFVNGLIQVKNDQLSLLNISLRPTRLDKKDKKAFDEIYNAQKIMNRLCYNSMHEKHIDIDHPMYTTILNKIRKIKPEKKIYSLFLRTDYIFEKFKEQVCPKQVEINTISCAFVIQGAILNYIHKLYYKNTQISNSDKSFIKFLAKIQELYVYTELKNEIDNTDDLCILIIDVDTSLKSSNVFEKLKIISLAKASNLIVFHVTYDDIRKYGSFICVDTNEEIPDQEIKESLSKERIYSKNYNFYYEKHRVCCVYYRWFYNFDHYQEDDIVLRAKIECSSTVSVPCVQGQIIGLKIFQIRFTDELNLLKFLTKEDSSFISKFFGSYEKFERKKLEKINIDEYVLKTLDEGGGKNFFGREIYNFQGNDDDVFLMKKIVSKSYKNFFANLDKEIEIHPEIGIMGWVIGTKSEIFQNEIAGYICRSKNVNSNECGVSCGFGALDSIEFEN